MSMPTRIRIGDNVSRNKQNFRLQVVHNNVPLFFLREGDNAGRDKGDILHG